MIYLSLSPRINIILRSFVLLYGSFLCGHAFAQNTETDQLVQANAAIAKQDWATAESILSPLAQNKPQNPFVLYDLAQVYENTQRASAAKQIYQSITSNAALIQSQPVMVIRAPYASRMVSLLSLSQAKLNAIEAKQSAASVVSSPVQQANLATPIASANTTNPPQNGTPFAISTTIQNWADAWANKDLLRYYASYTEDFHGDQVTRVAWEKQRMSNITRAKSIQLDFKNVTYTNLSPTMIQANFTQTYTSNILHDTVQKTVVFVLRNGKWLIDRETIK